jgi:glutathione S-transferase
MQLVGMLDSPYVRRVAIGLQLLGLPFEHQSLSVFRTYAEFRRINPVVKAPTLVCDDGTVLMDSTLMLDYAEARVRPRSLMPQTLPERARCLRVIGLALAGCEKAVQIVYEHNVRPAEKLHAPWLARVTEQMHAAFAALEAELTREPLPCTPGALDNAGLTTAVVWHFSRQMVPELLGPGDHPALAAYSAWAEALPEFMAAPHGDSTCIAPVLRA